MFKITPTGPFTLLHAFDCDANGCQPVAPLISVSGGTFYGTTS